jgi:hypothetical protein
MLKKSGQKKPLGIPAFSILPDVIEIAATETKRNSVMLLSRRRRNRSGYATRQHNPSTPIPI